MKKVLLGAVCAAGLLAGCSNDSGIEKEQAEEITKLKQQVEQVTLENEDLLNALQEERAAFKEAIGGEVQNGDTTEKTTVIQAEEIEQYPETLYKEEVLSRDDNGDPKQIVELYVNASTEADGELVMDDGQNWLLIVKDNEKVYPIYNDYLQLGAIDFMTTMFNDQLGIVMMKTAHGKTMLQKVIYNEEKDEYQVKTIYEEVIT